MPKRNVEHMNAQRERIIRATVICISRKGVEGSSMADILKEAGLSAGAVYGHFKNKADLIAQCLQHKHLSEPEPPETWEELKSRVLGFHANIGQDLATAIRARVHLNAECVNPGALHDILRPMLEEELARLAGWIDRIARKGLIALRMNTSQTAAGVAAHIDGMLWMALACNRPLDNVLSEISEGLDLFVTLGATMEISANQP